MQYLVRLSLETIHHIAMYVCTCPCLRPCLCLCPYSCSCSCSCFCSCSAQQERIGPKVVVIRRWAVGFRQTGEGGTMGEGWGKQGQFISNLRRRRTIPVTAGGRQVSERGTMGSKGSKGSKGQEEIAPCTYANVIYV